MGMLGNAPYAGVVGAAQLGNDAPAGVSDKANTSTGAFDIPSGTTAQRPSNPSIGYVRFNTDFDCMENFTSVGWLKVSVPVPILLSITGTVYSGLSTNLTLSGSNFGTGAGVVRFTSGGTLKDVPVTPTSTTSIAVAVPSEITSLGAGSSVDIKFTNSDGGISGAVSKTSVGLPTGGDVVVSGSYRYHVFKSSSSLSVPSSFAATASVLCVAGGGGGAGGNGGSGGGGAGGVTNGSLSISVGSYSVTVGAAGAGGQAQGVTGSNGTNSAVSGVTTAIGGGGGGGWNTNGGGASGGSGGGAGGQNNTAGSGTSGQGNNGGTSATPSSPYYTGGGGGGAGAVGGQGNSTQPGNGGAGTTTYSAWLTAIASAMSGVSGWATAVASGYIAGGGAGGSEISSMGGQGAGGGAGGGGNRGAGQTGSYGPTAGITNTGGGGGSAGMYTGSYVLGANGGSGLVVIRYPLPT